MCTFVVNKFRFFQSSLLSSISLHHSTTSISLCIASLRVFMVLLLLLVPCTCNMSSFFLFLLSKPIELSLIKAFFNSIFVNPHIYHSIEITATCSLFLVVSVVIVQVHIHFMLNCGLIKIFL